jgi:hypothetical protein
VTLTVTDQDGGVSSDTSQVVVQSLLDLDANSKVDPLTDGLLLLRYLFDFRGPALVRGVLGPNATRTTPSAIADLLSTRVLSALDIDADGQIDPLLDGLLVLRYLYDFRGPTLTRGLLGPQSSRTDPDEIVAFLDAYRPTSGKSSPPAHPSSAPVRAAILPDAFTHAFSLRDADLLGAHRSAPRHRRRTL